MTAAAIRAATGVAPVGWHTRSAPSLNTRRLLKEHGGFLYDSDAYSDDMPFFVEVEGERRLVLPYAFDTNDMNFFRTPRFVTGQDFADYVIAAFDRLWREGASAPRMLSVGLHLRMIGRPARIGGLETILGSYAPARRRLDRAARRHRPPLARPRGRLSRACACCSSTPTPPRR